MVVSTLAWPISSWIVRMSYPASNRCVANEWRNVCGEMVLVSPAPVTAVFTAFWIDCSLR